MKSNQKSILLILLLFSIMACSPQKQEAENTEPEEVETASEPIPQEAEWQSLLGENLENAVYDTCWKMEDGVLSASEDKMIWAKGTYENFELDLEFKNDPGTNSGVVVYCTDTANWIPNSVEIQIADDHSDKWGNSRLDYQCGAIFGHLPANQQKVVNPPGEWNRFQVTCQGQNITVVLNGQKVTEMDMSQWTSGTKNPDGSEIPSWLPTPFAELPTKGAIGFQGKHGDAKIYFRHVKIRSL
jgi:hypothetical protein